MLVFFRLVFCLVFFCLVFFCLVLFCLVLFCLFLVMFFCFLYSGHINYASHIFILSINHNCLFFHLILCKHWTNTLPPLLWYHQFHFVIIFVLAWIIFINKNVYLSLWNSFSPFFFNSVQPSTWIPDHSPIKSILVY